LDQDAAPLPAWLNGHGGLIPSQPVAENKIGSAFDFIADEVGRARVVRFKALEEKQERIVPAPFEFVADSADLLQIAVRVADENPCAAKTTATR
jgi:hypothetical protein